MSVVDQLLATPGVIAAGEYTFKAEMDSFKGELPSEWADVLAVMCHATTKNVVMETQMLAQVSPRFAATAARGWALRGPSRTLCVIANVFCLLDNQEGNFNRTMTLLRALPEDTSMELI